MCNQGVRELIGHPPSPLDRTGVMQVQITLSLARLGCSMASADLLPESRLSSQPCLCPASGVPGVAAVQPFGPTWAPVSGGV